MHDSTAALRHSVYRTVTYHRMFQSGDNVLVGVSGGPDSVALLHLLREMASRLNIALAVAHLNHNLRGAASDSDASFVTALAKRYHLTRFLKTKDVAGYRKRRGLSLETASRQVRYAFFFEVMETHGFNKLALGHQMDDNAELILMNLFRGSGLTGLAGIPPVRDHKIVRPLIDTTRQQIAAYLTKENHDFVIDTSNTDRRHLRNRIRSELLPLLKAKYNPRLVQGLNKMAAVCRSENRWVEEVIDPIFDRCVIMNSRKKIGFSIPTVSQQNPAVQRRLFRRAIKYITGDLRKVSFENIEAVKALLSDGQAWKSIDLPHQIRVRRTDQTLIFSQEKRSLRRVSPHLPQAVGPVFTYQVTPPGEVVIAEVGLRLVFSILDKDPMESAFDDADTTALMDLETLTFPLTIRNWKAADRFSPLGLGGTQSVHKFLAGREKDRAKRPLCPVLVSQNRIVWVIGHRIADEVKIGPTTSRALKGAVVLA